MIKSEEIIAGLQAIVNNNVLIATLRHFAIYGLIISLLFNWNPSNKMMAILFCLDVKSHYCLFHRFSLQICYHILNFSPFINHQIDNQFNLIHKHMNRLIPMAFLFICLFTGCASQNGKNDEIFIIPIADYISRPYEIKCSQFIDDFEYIQLETNEKCLIPDGFKALILKNHILVYGVKYCYTFDRKTGKFLYEISKYGRGPNEYQSSLIAYNYSDSLIYSLGWNGNSLVFDLNGNFRGEFPLPSSVRGMENPSFINRYSYLKDSILVGYYPNILGIETKLLATFNQKGEQIKVFPNRNVFPKRPLKMMDLTDAHFYHAAGDTYFKERSVDTVFKVNAESLIPHIIFETGKFSVPYEYKWWTLEERKNVNFIFINEILENSKWLFVLAAKESVDYFALYNKPEQQLIVTKKGDGIPNDVDDFIPFNPQFMDVDGNFVEFVNASKISTWFRDNPSKTSDKTEALRNLEITRNPVIMTGKSKTR